MSYERPRERKGLVAWYARWNRDGTLREVRYRKREREAELPVTPRVMTKRPMVNRGALAAERKARQGSLDL